MARALSLIDWLRHYVADSISPRAGRSQNFFSGVTSVFLLALPVLAQNHSAPSCRQLTLAGEVKQGAEWSASIGYPAAAKESSSNWLIRLVPTHGSAAHHAPANNFAGWTLAVSPSTDQDYPDALLLASPPYGSLNSREIATTYGMRAQDAIAWTPRRFHFFTSSATLIRARQLYRELLDPNSPAAIRQRASTQLLNLSTDADKIAAGKLEILDARLIAGSADPAPFASQWATAFDRLPHTLDPAGKEPSMQGELHSFRFRIVLWLPTLWKTGSGTETTATECAE